MDQLPISWLVAAKVTAIVSSGIFAGYTWSLSHAAVPAILEAPEALMAKQWRMQYIHGFLFAIPATILNLVCWGSLAYTMPPSSSARPLYTMAAVATGSGTVFAWTALRSINGGLSLRSEKLIGSAPKTIALTYSKKEKWSRDMDANYATAELVRMWMNYNSFRAAILIAGTVIGALGLALDPRR